MAWWAAARGQVSGHYRARTRTREVELRIDLDGAPATNRVSADYFARLGPQTMHLGSMRLDVFTTTTTPSGDLEIRGVGVFTFPVTAPVVRVRIPRPPVGEAPASVQLDHLTPLGQPGDSFTCGFESSAFRTGSDREPDPPGERG